MKHEDGKPVSDAEEVPFLSEESVLARPENIPLFSVEPYGEVIYLPFQEP